MIPAPLRPYRRRAALAILLGTATICAGIGLLATSGYLISRAALEPPILTLTVAIVGVRFFAILRALLRATGAARARGPAPLPQRRSPQPVRGRRRLAPAPLSTRACAAARRC